ncbi:MFS transporter [Nocardioides immobilis]|uniref:MFS transporter n=1 Tax=Nocardioides immobilis TaxID=2049295 RepID=A0A417Y0R7_9ACTN|nr:MFS transporter [Nocardioides immobilis]RHW26223.1 MFS transporter [Nocardioides immobilis]
MARRPSSTRTTVFVLAMGVGAFGLLQSLILPVLPQVQQRFETDQSTTAWVLTSYLLSAAVAAPLIGRIGDAVGKQRMLIVTLGLLAVGSAMAALAPTIEWMLVARVVQGLGGGVMPLSFGIIRDEVAAARAPVAIGIVASLVSAAFGIGIVLAGPIVEGLGYTWLFWVPSIVTALAAIGAFVFVPESPVRLVGRINPIPALLLSGWLVLLLLAVSEGNDWGWGSLRILAMLGSAVVLFGGWVWVEQRIKLPLIDIRLMRSRGVWTANAVAFAVGFGTFASLAFLPQMLQAPTQTGYGFAATITASGLVLLPASALGFVMGWIAPRLVRRFSARSVICVGAASNAFAYAAVGLFHGELWQVGLWMVVQGIGNGCVVSSLAGVVLGAVPPHQSGVASGMNSNIRLVGGSIGSAVMAGIVTARSDGHGYALEAGYRNGFLALAVGALAAVGFALLIPAPEVLRARGQRAPYRLRKARIAVSDEASTTRSP